MQVTDDVMRPQFEQYILTERPAQYLERTDSRLNDGRDYANLFVQEAWEAWRAALKGLLTTRVGPSTPNNDMVICPCCTSQFTAIPVNIQSRLAALESPPAIPVPSHVHCQCCGDPKCPETSRELERLRELQEKALALDDAVAEFGIDKPQYIAEVYQAFHDVLHDGHGSPSVVKTLVEVRAFGTSIDPPSQKASACECVQYCAIYNKGTPGCRNLPLHPRDAQGKESKP